MSRSNKKSAPETMKKLKMNLTKDVTDGIFKVLNTSEEIYTILLFTKKILSMETDEMAATIINWGCKLGVFDLDDEFFNIIDNSTIYEDHRLKFVTSTTQNLRVIVVIDANQESFFSSIKTLLSQSHTKQGLFYFGESSLQDGWKLKGFDLKYEFLRLNFQDLPNKPKIKLGISSGNVSPAMFVTHFKRKLIVSKTKKCLYPASNIKKYLDHINYLILADSP